MPSSLNAWRTLTSRAVFGLQVVGRLTGILAAVFSLAQFTTSLLWGVISNIVGRKVRR